GGSVFFPGEADAVMADKQSPPPFAGGCGRDSTSRWPNDTPSREKRRAGPPAGHLARRAAGQRYLPFGGGAPPRAREGSVRRHPPLLFWLMTSPQNTAKERFPQEAMSEGACRRSDFVPTTLRPSDQRRPSADLRGLAGACFPGKRT